MGINQYVSLGLVSNSLTGDMGIFKMFGGATTMVKVVIVTLVFTSIASWSIIFNKLIILHGKSKAMDDFERKFGKSEDVKDFYNKFSSVQSGFLAKVFNNGFKKIESCAGIDEKKNFAIREAHNTMLLTAERELRNAECNLSILATVASTSPFVGLFGTVWGIMTSFQAIASAKNTSIAVVAPGIAEALLVTAIGLFAAIPALVFYNKFSTDIDKMTTRIDHFIEAASIKLEKFVD
ncbi:biopolymer transport protein TolQ [Candidatus Xenohaliotis californiensis]|uniref:Biopolymer transport protein TolQ n=1 Tax=Candidatus Xenohaliotis californiensis TaxID=84677 RepID=A0ABM9N835_9RICK|nr:biopolymer transport protein TolQ [Candidatus Xenohaliotis californiensis]